MNKTIMLAGIDNESLVNGPGMRRVFFSQGCNHNCKGCFNPNTHSKDGGKLCDIDELVGNLKNNPSLKGVTFSGGDPFQQPGPFATLAEKIKSRYNKFNIWAYTGYTVDELSTLSLLDNNIRNLLNQVDVIVDGRFEENNISDKIKFRGSTNQRIYKVIKNDGLFEFEDISDVFDKKGDNK